MSKLTRLEIVQDILNDINGDEVNAISDTEEATQIAQIVKTTFFEMIGDRDWPHLSRFTVLNSVGDSSKPTHLNTPENMKRMDWFKYNKVRVGDTRNRYEDVIYLHPDEFINKTNDRILSNDNVVEVTDFGGAKFQIFNDRAPKYFTSFDDRYVVLDSFDSDVESTIQGSKTQVKIYITPIWEDTDEFVPDLPIEAFPGFLAEAKSVAAYKQEREMDEKAEQQSTRQRRRMSYQSWSVNGGIRYPNYGKPSGRTASSNLFNKHQRS